MTPPQAVIDNALRNGHLVFDEITDARFGVEERAHRNTLQLVRTHRQTLSYKRFETSEECRHEQAALLTADQHDRSYELPQVIGCHDRTLITRTSPGLQPLGSTRGTAPTSARIARCAEAIASLHEVSVDVRTGLAAQPVRLDGIGPWILDSSPAARTLIKTLQESSVHDAIDELMVELSTHDMVWSHGDIRPANLLVGRDDTICLIDWETAGRASRWQDLGALLATVLELAMHAGKGPPDGKVARAIVQSYASATGVPIAVSLLVRSAGVRLLQTAVEQAFHEWEASAQTRAILSAGRLFLLRPTRAALHMRIHGG